MPKVETLLEKSMRLRAARLARDGAQSKREIAPRWQPFGLEDELPFGKHQGSTVQEVVDTDVDWLIWAIDNIKDFCLTSDAEFEVLADDDPRRTRRAIDE